jgi:hypothetical protein
MTQTAHAIAYNVSKALRYREYIFFSLVAVVLFFAGAYIFFIRSAIVNVVARQDIVKEIQTDTTSVSSLENQYFNLKSSITMDTATSLGFSNVAVAAFIPASPAVSAVSSVVLSSNDEI